MSTPLSILHAAAREYAAAGIPIFPVEPAGKKPANSRGFLDSTTDLARVDEIWGDNPNLNIGACPDFVGNSVVDIEADGIDMWEILKQETPPTRTVRTPNGGLHLTFKGSMKSSVRKLFGPDIAVDTRGQGGYVLLPPSIVMAKDGTLRSYVVEDDHAIGDLPDWIKSGVATTAVKVEASGAELDTVGDRARARRHLVNLVRANDVAIAGRGGNNRAYQVSCELLELGVAPDTALVLLEEEWSPHCIPPWTRDELATHVLNASNYMQNGGGAYATASAAETFAASTDFAAQRAAEAEEEQKNPKRSRFYFENDAEMDKTPAQNWVIPELIPDRSCCMLYGASGSYKSFLLIAMALGKATGKATLGFEALPRGPVFYGAGEGRDDVKVRRRGAWKKAHGVTGETGFYVGPTPRIAVPEELQEFGDMIKATLDRDGYAKPGLIMLETVSKMMVGLDPTRDAPKLTRFCETLQEAFGCPVVVVHHTGHDPKKGPRDSSAYLADFDVILRIDGVKATKCTTMTVEKMKGAAEREEPLRFQGEVVLFKNPQTGDTEGSLVFQRISEQDFDLLNPNEGEEPKVGKAAVGAALMKLKAQGIDQAVAQRVLAGEVAMALELIKADTPADRSIEVVENVDRLLGRLAPTRPLRPYNEKRNGQRLWFLPGAAAEQAPDLKG